MSALIHLAELARRLGYSHTAMGDMYRRGDIKAELEVPGRTGLARFDEQKVREQLKPKREGAK